MKLRLPKTGTWNSHLLSILGAGLLVALASTVLGQSAKPEVPTPVPVCDRWHRGTGSTTPLDVTQIARAYLDVKRRFDTAVAQSPKNLEEYLKRPHLTGLRACRSRQRRDFALKVKRVPGLAGKIYYFASPDDRGSLRLPETVRDAKPDAVFILELGQLSQLGDIARSTGKPTYVASRPFAEALGVRCSGTLVRISENGNVARIDEGL